nr:uncharacterized protein LOC129258351 [Lytechinus pictus]
MDTMSRRLCHVLAVTLMVLVNHSDGHLCIITPRQRGDFDISTPGSRTCTRHQSPCGGQPAEAPKMTYMGGKTALIRFQQNFNHYEVGLPGYMDISLAQNVNSTDFQTLTLLGDTNEHLQRHQRNYTVPVVMPNVSCDHCVLRMRYVSHKAGEEIFYQCSDIAIKAANSTSLLDDEDLDNEIRESIPVSIKRAMNLHRRPITVKRTNTNEAGVTPIRPNAPSNSLYGITWDPLQTTGSKLVNIDFNTGAIESRMGLYFGMGPNVQYGTVSPTAPSDKFVMDQIACYSREIPYLFLLEHRNGNLDASPNKILWIDMSTMALAGEYEIEGLESDIHIAALNSYQRTNFLTFEIQPTKGSPGNFTLMFGTLDYMGNHIHLFTEPSPENLYVNFLWATVDLKRQMYYVLMGNENAPVKLNSRIHSFNITSRNITCITEVDVSQFTINAIQIYEKTGQLFAVSPGLFPQEYPPWYLVEVNPVTGSVKPVTQIAAPGMFAPYYGGAIVNIDQTHGLLFYNFRVADSRANIIATVSLDTFEVFFSQLTSLQLVHNIAHFDAYAP